jgi:hypothetical protein
LTEAPGYTACVDVSNCTKLCFTRAGSEKRWYTNNEKESGRLELVRTLDR